jgi:hypothetical protein
LSIDYDDSDVETEKITQPETNKEFLIPRRSEILTWQFNNLGLKYLRGA